MSAFHETLMNLPQVPTVIISVALMLFSGFLLTRVTKRLRELLAPGGNLSAAGFALPSENNERREQP